MITNHHEQVIDVFNKHFGKDAPIIGIEIGTMAGDLTKALLLNFPNMLLTTVDPWEHRDGAEYEAGNNQKYHDAQKTAAYGKLKEYSERVIMTGDTSDKHFDFLQSDLCHTESGIKQFDFVWIDGDHTKEQVQRDIENYFNVVKPGGIIGGHDYDLAPDVKGVVDSFFAEDMLFTGVDFTWWVKKKEK